MKKRILLVSLLLIMMLVWAMPMPGPVEASAPDAPAPAAVAAPVLELAEEGTAFSVVTQTAAPVSAQEALLYASVAGLILATIVASVATLRRRILSLGHRIAASLGPGSGVNRQCYVAGG